MLTAWHYAKYVFLYIVFCFILGVYEEYIVCVILCMGVCVCVCVCVCVFRQLCDFIVFWFSATSPLGNRTGLAGR